MASSLAALAAAVLAVLVAWAGGVTARSLRGGPLEDYAYGFFLDRYAIFAFVLVYGLAQLAALALTVPGRRVLRLALLPMAALLLLAAGLHPTFGGLILRAGYFAGAGSVLQGAPSWAALALGTAVAGLVFATVLGLAAMLLRPGRPSWRGARRALASGLAAWLGALVLAAPRALGLPMTGDWPQLPLALPSALATAALLALALLPHALATGRSRTARPRPPSA